MADVFYDGQDSCLQFFSRALADARPPLHASGATLEIGCAEADWLSPAQRQWPAMTLTGIDWRKSGRKGVTATILRSDVLTYDFPAASFDTIVLVSALEHIGLGHYNDPRMGEGDSLCMARAHGWLKPGGWLWFDVPWNVGDSYTVCGTKYRVYDDATITSRLDQGLGWSRGWTGWAFGRHPELIPRPDLRIRDEDLPRKHFYVQGQWWQKTSAPVVVA